MRITRETLIRIAKETAIQRSHFNPKLIAAYLTGSLRTEDPFLSGTTDIDLVFVHADEPKVRREIVSLTPEVHLDIQHNPRSVYDRPKELRVNPWLGPELYDPMLLYDSEHFFEFTQAGVRHKYHEPASVLARARQNAETARQLWNGLQCSQESGPVLVLSYLTAVKLAANAIAVLNGGPLAERRFLLQFPARAEAAGKPGLAAGLFGLLGAPSVDAAALSGLLPGWEKSFLDAAGRPKVDIRIHPARLGYYKLAFEAMLASENPKVVLWPLLHTWTLAAAVLPPTKQDKWQSACEQVGLAVFNERLEGLDHFLDNIEELLEGMAASHNL